MTSHFAHRTVFLGGIENDYYGQNNHDHDVQIGIAIEIGTFALRGKYHSVPLCPVRLLE